MGDIPIIGRLFCHNILFTSHCFYVSYRYCVSGSSLFNSVSLMAYNVFYTSIPVLTCFLDKDLSEKTVLQNPQILVYCQAGRLLNPSTFAGWFGRSAYHALVVFLVTVHAYSNEKNEMEEVSMVALSGCIWLQVLVVILEMNSFTVLQHIAIWGNFLTFYAINSLVSTIPRLGMYTIMFRLFKQPSYWITMTLILAIGMGPVLAIKYFRYTYRPNTINILQQQERSGGPVYVMGLENLESQIKPMDPNLTPLSVAQSKSRNPVHEPLLSDSPTATRRSVGPSTFDYFSSTQSRLSSSYSRNLKNN